jgi:hypothetical protein
MDQRNPKRVVFYANRTWSEGKIGQGLPLW